MQSKNKRQPTKAESEHIERIKNEPCAVCDAPPPSDCHELKQGDWYTSLPLCKDCHQGSINGIHGQRRMWAVKKLDELGALNIALGRLFK